ncbi:MAG: hypothetical protein JWL83_1357 [Actinomycetia bacterium]|nr:hypothetical protein [Actinomycetes bacterium]
MTDPARRLLFVDDDGNVLSGLRRMLRGMRQDWDMVFASGGEDAIELLRSRDFDVLITDMRMPGVDGLELLRTARAEWPSVVRIVLSGHTEASTAIRSMPLAHRFLSKPCDPEVLIETVRRTCELEDRLHSDRLRRILGRVDSLPSAPQATVALNRLLDQEEVAIDDVADVIATDPAMAAKLLQLVNSAFFGLARQVTTVRQAVAYLGINVVRNLAAALGAMGAFDESNAADRSFLEAHHVHSHAVAAIAADLVPPPLAAETFGVALLHDIGLLVIAQCMPDELVVIEDAVTRGTPRTAAEHEVIGASHAEIGAYLLALWGLPYTIIEATSHHHDQPPGPTPAVPDALHATFIAEALVCEGSRATGSWTEDLTDLDPEYLRSVGVDPGVDRLLEAAQKTGTSS